MSATKGSIKSYNEDPMNERKASITATDENARLAEQLVE